MSKLLHKWNNFFEYLKREKNVSGNSILVRWQMIASRLEAILVSNVIYDVFLSCETKCTVNKFHEKKAIVCNVCELTWPSASTHRYDPRMTSTGVSESAFFSSARSSRCVPSLVSKLRFDSADRKFKLTNQITHSNISFFAQFHLIFTHNCIRLIQHYHFRISQFVHSSSHREVQRESRRVLQE